MSKKLLHKTLRANLLFSVVVLLVAAPLFYFASQRLYLDETDETLGLKKDEFIKVFRPGFKEADIVMWNKINRDLKIRKNTVGIKTDTFFFRTSFDSIVMEDEYCRVLETPLSIEGNSYMLEVRVSMVESEDLLENIVLLFTGILLFLLLGFYFITRILSKKLWQPFYNTLEKIEQFEIDKSAHPVFEAISTEEFQRLDNAIEKLIQRNTAIYSSQREFVENAAHELQTPLAVFQAKIDMLIQRSDITEGQSEILTQLNESVSRLNKLNKNLLLLSKIESQQFAETESVVLNDIFRKQMDFFIEQAEAKNIDIHIRMDEEVTVICNQIMAEVLISNLFLNAIRHNLQDGRIDIKLDKVSLVFSNTGSTGALDEARLFQRFAKAHVSSSGNGLGLAIVRKIADINKWNIGYRYENNCHIFEIRF